LSTVACYACLPPAQNTYLEVVPDHLLEDKVQLAVGDVSVTVDVVDLEREAELLVAAAL
jgi:hypothetical protein